MDSAAMSNNNKQKAIEALEALTKPVSQKATAEARKKPTAGSKKGKNSTSSTSTETQSKAFSKLLYRSMDSVQSKPINWLWPGRIACGKVTLIAGDPGLGKSQITASLAGIVTTGGKWPVDGAKSQQGTVIFLSAEDDAADTIKPRLEAVGADLSRCLVIDAIVDCDEVGTLRERSFSVKNDLARLDAVLHEVVDVRLIIIDPITAYMGGVDSHKTSDVREFMSPLVMFAEKHGVAILGISHLNKSSTQDALQRVNGSLAIVAAARAAFIAVKDKNNPARRLLLPLKNNLAKDVGGFAFSIADTKLESGIETSCIVWEDAPVNMTADEAMSVRIGRDDTGAVNDAVQFLLDLLSTGALPSGEVKEEAEKAGFSWSTIRRAKDNNSSIKAEKNGFNGGWIWALSEGAQHEGAQPLYTTMSAFDGGHATQGLEGHGSAEGAQVFCLSAFDKTAPQKSLVLDTEI